MGEHKVIIKICTLENLLNGVKIPKNKNKMIDFYWVVL